MDELSGLNREQRSAVTHLDGPLLVVAGAGTGKTQVITRRIAHLITTERAKPEQVLALTFTEKAAREMADRLYDLIGWRSFSVPVMTFNAFGAELLGRYSTHIGRSTRGGLLNETQKALLLQQRLPELELRYYGLQPDPFEFALRLVSYLGRLQNQGVTAADYRQFVAGLDKDPGERHPADIDEQHDLAAIYDLYEAIKAETGTYDYYDQLALPLEILRERPNLAERLRQLYRYVLVDEYQDTNPVQDALLRSFIGPVDNLFVVGDDDQAIYGFRGADISNILDFTEHFKVQQTVTLTQNYRSGQPILDAAYRLIVNNDPDRLEARLGLNKRLVGQTSEAEVLFKGYRTPADELVSVVDEIAARLGAGEAPGEIAVLARSNAAMRVYAKALRARNLPYAISTAANIFEQRELINLWYLLEWIGHRASDEAIAHVVVGPFVGWTAAAWRGVVEQAKSGLVTAEAALREMAHREESAAKLVAQLDEWRDWAADETVSRLAYRLVFETGLVEELKTAGEANARIIRVFEDLHRLLGQMEDYQTVSTDDTLAGYLAQFPRPPLLEVSETLGEPDGVQLLTVHASKGLEFDTVYLVGCTARSWGDLPAIGLTIPPELMPLHELPAVHELRRLMYVAVTRARRRLFLSAAGESAGGQRQALSPLVNELLTDLPATPAVSEAKSTDKLLTKLQQFYPLQHELPSRLPFEQADGWIELAVGALQLYDDSPHDFYLQYVLGISQPFGPQLSFGSAVHGAIQAYYEARLRGEVITVDELDGRLDELWSDRGYDSREVAEAARHRAHETIARFKTREDSLKRGIEAAELTIRLEIPEAKLRLRGRIDATFKTSNGLEVRDFKTGMQRDEEKIAALAKKSFQLRCYALAMKELTGVAPAAVTLDYVVTGVEASVEPTARVLANHREKLIKLADSLRQRDFTPAAPSPFKSTAAFKYYGSEEDSPDEA